MEGLHLLLRRLRLGLWMTSGKVGGLLRVRRVRMWNRMGRRLTRGVRYHRLIALNRLLRSLVGLDYRLKYSYFHNTFITDTNPIYTIIIK